MSQIRGFSADIESQGPLNVEGNQEAQVQGRDIDASTPLLQHDNVFIRVPARVSNIVIEVVQPIVGNPAALAVSVLLLIGISLAFVAATSQDFNPMLVIAAAGIFIVVGIINRLNSVRS